MQRFIVYLVEQYIPITYARVYGNTAPLCVYLTKPDLHTENSKGTGRPRSADPNSPEPASYRNL